MKDRMRNLRVLVLTVACVVVIGLPVAAEPQTSPRMEKAKDYIADEQWVRAIEVLTQAAADPKEKNRDEALYWLAHSQYQAKNLAAAVETIRQLERQFPKSRWVKPAGYIRVELAQHLRRDDVLWTYAVTVPARPTTVTPAAPVVVTPLPAPASAPRAAGAGGRRPGAGAAAPTVWVSENTVIDNDVRIQALSSLLKTDAQKVIPMLRTIALESRNPNEASRAVFVLAQSGRPDAHATVLEVARGASEQVSVAAVRELGRFGGPTVHRELLELYDVAKPRVKYQVVSALGERSATTALMRIAQSESDPQLKRTAIVTLGQAGGREQLRTLYRRAAAEMKRPIILGLFNARAEDDLIRIAQQERDAGLRREIHDKLRLLGTPRAKAYLEKVGERR